MQQLLRKCITLFCIFCVILSVKGEYVSCNTPSGMVGSCIPLSGCQILSELATSKFKTWDQMNYLQKSICGSANTNLLVCCPAQNSLEWSPFEGFAEIESYCETPGGITGKCVSLKSCPTVLHIVRKPTRTRSEISYLQKSQCGYTNGEYMVCCPKTEFTTQTVPPTTTTTPKPINLYPIMSPKAPVVADCRTPNRMLGVCIEIEKCPTLKAVMLKEKLTVDEQNLLLNSKCGAKDSPTVCCPKQNDALRAATEASVRIFTTPLPGVSCFTPGGVTGKCIPIKSCTTLLDILTKENRTAFETLYLQRSQCGYTNGEYMVCCPKIPKTLFDTSTKTTPKSKPTTISPITPTITTPLPGVSCFTPGGVTGKCIPIKSCTTLLDILTKENRTAFETLYLQRSQCGYTNGEYMVCCPKIPKALFDTSTKTTPKSKPTTRSPITPTITTPLPGVSCFTPGGVTGKCIPIKSCTTLLDILTKENRTAFETLYLQNSQCGYTNGEYMVCCPKTMSTSQTISSSATTKITTATTARPINSSPIMSATGPNIELPQGNRNKWINEEECGTSFTQFRIVGGHAVSIDEYPWAARLIYSDSDNNIDFFCGGSLIHKNYVLTAAHCVVLSKEKSDWGLRGVRLGEWNTATAPDCEQFSNGRALCAPQHIDIDVFACIVHPKYQKQPFNYDIALLMLGESVTYTNFVKPICLPSSLAGQQTINYENELVEIVGWGKTKTAEHSEVKLKAELKVIDIKKCKTNRGTNINQICAKGDVGTDSCNGDSGGPLMHKQTHYGNTAYYLIGVISFGLGGDCGDIQTNGMYMSVVNFMDWIVENTQDSP